MVHVKEGGLQLQAGANPWGVAAEAALAPRLLPLHGSLDALRGAPLGMERSRAPPLGGWTAGMAFLKAEEANKLCACGGG